MQIIQIWLDKCLGWNTSNPAVECKCKHILVGNLKSVGQRFCERSHINSTAQNLLKISLPLCMQGRICNDDGNKEQIQARQRWWHFQVCQNCCYRCSNANGRDPLRPVLVVVVVVSHHTSWSPGRGHKNANFVVTKNCW